MEQFGSSGGGASEGVRPRMSVEEQMERIRRHQQASLRRRDSSGGTQEGSLSRSSSFNREQISTNPYYTLQVTTPPSNYYTTIYLQTKPPAPPMGKPTELDHWLSPKAVS